MAEGIASSGAEGSPPFTPPPSPTKLNGSDFASLPPPSNAGLLRNLSSPFLIGVAGGTASGKTTVCKKIMEQLGQLDSSHKRVVMLSQDSFYKKLDAKDKKLANRGDYNFDHPGISIHRYRAFACILLPWKRRPFWCTVFIVHQNGRRGGC